MDFTKDILYMVTWITIRVVSMVISYFLLIIAITIAWRYLRGLWCKSKRRPVSSKGVVLITGATSGIGLALAKFLHHKGYSVIVGYYNEKEPGFDELQELRKVASGLGLKQLIELVRMDVRHHESIAAAYDHSAKYIEANDLHLIAIVNNAGLGSLQPFSWIQQKTIVNLVQTNLLGSLLVAREFLPLLIKSKGRIINVSSGLGVVPGPTYITYGATKSALIYFTLAINQELEHRYGVKSVVVIPHNFIKNTNITANNTLICQNSWNDLKLIEKDLYKKDYDEHCKLSGQLQEATRKHMKLVAEHETKKKSNQHKIQSGCSRLLGWTRVVAEFFERLKGSNESISLDESLACFEDAISLKNPSEYIFAGDSTYDLIVGSILLCLPASCLKFLGKNISTSMYK